MKMKSKQRFDSVLCITGYLIAIVLANLSASYFGPWALPVNAFLFIGLDLTSRDRLHDIWKHNQLVLKMGLLILAGSVLTVALNIGAGRIALASCISFAIAALVDTVVYHALGDKAKFVKVNGSNVASAAIDSIIFPWIAFGNIGVAVVALQFIAKVFGGLLWSRVIFRRE